jgi:hypothetical protein
VATFRRCRWCRHPLVKPGGPKASTRTRDAHCTGPQCDWCQPCYQRRDAASRAGRLDLLTEPETAVEQTREIPAVQDEIPPDQMT